MNIARRPTTTRRSFGSRSHDTEHSTADRLLTIEQAATHMNTTVRFIRRLIAERRIAFVKLGRHVRIAKSDIDAFVAAGRVEPLTAEDVWAGLRRVA